MAQMQLRSPAQPSPRTNGGPLSPSTVGYENTFSGDRRAQKESATLAGEQTSASKGLYQPLSVTHPRPQPINTSRCDAQAYKTGRRPDTEAEDLVSPDALYFGKRSRRTYGGHATRRSIAVEPSFFNLKTSSRIQKVQDEEMIP